MKKLETLGLIDKITLTPKQEQFLINILYSPVFKYLWYVGGFGAGKSFTGCLAGILLSVLEPNNRGLISRSTLIDLKHTTKKTFEEVLQLCGYLEGVHYTFTSTPSPTYKFSNGSEIIMMGLDDEQKIKGLELGWYYIDEVDEVPEIIFNILRGRLRLKGIKRYVGFITSNSAGKNWTYNIFIQGKGVTQEELRQYYVIRASSFENPNLAPEYLDTLAGYDDNLYKRFVLGEFNVFEGQIYPEFNELIHVQDNVMERFVDRTTFTPIYGLDHGLHNPTAILEGWIDGQGNIYLTWEHYVPQEGIGTHATAFGGRMSESGVKNPMIAGDPSLFNKNQQPTPEKPFPFSIADLYEDYGIHITPANNSVLAGINFTKELFAQNKIMIDRSMTNLIDELNKYVWSSDRLKEHQDRPVKKHDHAVDALRYLLMTRQQGPKEEKDYGDGLMAIINKDIEKLNNIDTISTKRRTLTQ